MNPFTLVDLFSNAMNQGLIHYDFAKDYYHHYLPPRILHNKTRRVFCDAKRKVWITSAGGLNTYNNNTRKFNSYVLNEKGRLTLKNNYLNCVAHGGFLTPIKKYVETFYSGVCS